MKLIIGGAFQGKLDYAKETYHIDDGDVFVCADGQAVDWSRKVIYGLEQYALDCVRKDLLPDKEIEKHFEQLEDTVVIVNDIACGIVPMDKTERAWREANGRMTTKLAFHAEEVTRVFCGLGLKLKG